MKYYFKPQLRVKFYVRDNNKIVSPFARKRVPNDGETHSVLYISRCRKGFHTPLLDIGSIYNWASEIEYGCTIIVYNKIFARISTIYVALVQVSGWYNCYKEIIPKENWSKIKIIKMVEFKINDLSAMLRKLRSNPNGTEEFIQFLLNTKLEYVEY